MTQIVGKVRLALTPWLNHGWHVALYVTPRGLTTSPIPSARDRSRSTSTCAATPCASPPRTPSARSRWAQGRSRTSMAP
ncbi:MAG: DUF5996 family protein [Sphingomonas sp.]